MRDRLLLVLDNCEHLVEACAQVADTLLRGCPDLTILATEKVTRKSLDEADQKRLVEEALAELDFSSLSGDGRS